MSLSTARAGNGRYHILEVETRGFKGPPVYDSSGIPLHAGNQSVINERIYLDKPTLTSFHNQIRVIDHAYDASMDDDQSYRRSPNPRPVWSE